jgi:hypothetical protein
MAARRPTQQDYEILGEFRADPTPIFLTFPSGSGKRDFGLS